MVFGDDCVGLDFLDAAIDEEFGSKGVTLGRVAALEPSGAKSIDDF